jgi:hypothetical protein
MRCRTRAPRRYAQLRQKGNPLIPQPHLDILQVRDGLSAYVPATSLGKGMRFPGEGNVTDQDLRERTRQIFETFFEFSTVRKPWARAVSHFHRREGVRPGDETSFEKLCEQDLYASDACRHPTLHGNQLDWLSTRTATC